MHSVAADDAGTLATTDERLFFRPPGDETEVPAAVPAVLPAPRRRSLVRLPKAVSGRELRVSVERSIDSALRREAGLGTAFLFLPVALIAGVLIYFALPVEPAVWNISLGLAALAAILLVARSARISVRNGLVAAFTIVAGMGIAQWQAQLAATPMLGADVTTRLTGRIIEIQERDTGRTRFTLAVISTERPQLRYSPKVVRVTAAGGAGDFTIGQGIRGVVRLTSPSGPAHPGGYDFAFHAYFDGIGANGFFLGKAQHADVGPPGFPGRLALAVESMRRAIGGEIRRVAPGRAGAVATALVTGDTSGIPEDVSEALRVAGLAHILSISGLHMALVAATVMAALRLGFAFRPVWSSRHPVKKYAAIGALAATGFYLFLAGAGVATQRSFVMLAIMLLALLFDRNAVTMRNLALAALVVVVLSPHEVLGPSFQMSFSATAALIAVYSGWQDYRSARPPRRAEEAGMAGNAARTAWRYVVGIAVTSLVAGAATNIFASYHFGRVAPYGLLANLAAMPVVSVMVMPLAVISLLAMPFGLHAWPFKAMAWAVELVIEIAERVAALSPATMTGQMPMGALLCFTLGLVLVCLFSTRLRWMSLPMLLAGLVQWHGQSPPVALVSEDGKQFAVLRQEDGVSRLHVNRDRPSAFTLEQWSAAYRADEIVKPGKSDVMMCDDDGCVATVEAGGRTYRIAWVSTPGRMVACSNSDMVILAKAPSPRSCANGTPTLSAQALALNGSAEIRIGGEEQLEIVQALPGPVRPWLDHRRYSRAARNIEEWKPRGNDDQ